MQSILREVNNLVIHCADTPNGRPQTVADIDSWHKAKGFARLSLWRIKKNFNPSLNHIGYHFVIYVDGSIHSGRFPDEIGAHVEGHNTKSIGICLVGRDKFTPRQWASLRQLVIDLAKNLHDGAHHLTPAVVGHCSFDTAIAQGKTCPGFDVAAWVRCDMTPDEKHVLITEVAA